MFNTSHPFGFIADIFQKEKRRLSKLFGGKKEDDGIGFLIIVASIRVPMDEECMECCHACTEKACPYIHTDENCGYCAECMFDH